MPGSGFPQKLVLGYKQAVPELALVALEGKMPHCIQGPALFLYANSLFASSLTVALLCISSVIVCTQNDLKGSIQMYSVFSAGKVKKSCFKVLPCSWF
mgnify:CR=1 FL=1